MSIIVVNDIKKNYKDICALKGVNLEIETGELFGLLGVNGAGKTTLIKILSGLTKSSSGEAFIDGYSVNKEIDNIKKIIDVSPQETSLAPNLTVKENLDFFASIYDIDDKEYIEYIIDKFNLYDALNKRAKTLSGGYQRRLSIAIALISKPKVLFLDEPTLGLDVIARRELWHIIENLKGKMTIILTSHYLEEIEALCDRVAIMSKGNVLEVGSIEEIKAISGKDKFEDAFVEIVERGNK